MMMPQLCYRVLILAVGITVLAGVASGRGVLTDDEHDLHLHNNDSGLRVDKIVGGEINNTPGKHPYMAYVQHPQYDEHGNWKYDEHGNELWTRCGGTLIHEEWVLTAGHCVDVDNQQNIVILGATRLDSQNTYQPEIEAIAFRHDEYSQHGAIYSHDIALLKLDDPVRTTGRGVKTARLPDATTSFNWKNCVTAGWGRTVAGSQGVDPSRPSIDLKEARMIQYAKGECLYYYKDLLTSVPHTFCALSDSASPCIGDSGGPLMCFDRQVPKGYALAGIFMGTDGKCDKTWPSVFLEVSEYTNWIRRITHVDF